MNDDTISRQAAIDETWKEPSYTDPYNVLTEVRERIQSLPSAQQEIIRCKDCKNYYFADNRVQSEQSWVCAAWGVDQTAHMGYCFKAERRTDDVVEVVRCKDCKKYNTDDCMMIHGKKMNRNIFANDYCSYGEKADT